MLNKNDPLIGAVQEVMRKNVAEREAAKIVNEKFGIVDRRALPHEQQANWDAAYAKVLSEGVEALDEMSEKQKKLAKVGNKAGLGGNPNEIDAPDLKGARMGHAKHIEEEQLEEKASEAQKAKIAKVMSKWKRGKEHIGKSEKTVPVTKAGQKQAVAIALSKAGLSKKKMDEDFNNHHSLSDIASAKKQAVMDQLNEKYVGGTVAPMQKPQAKPAGSPMPQSGTASSWTGPAGSMNPLDKRTDMQRATQAAGAMAVNRAKEQAATKIAARQNAADTAMSGRVGLNTFRVGASAEAQRRREAGQPVLQAKDVPGLNRDPKAVQAAQQRSKEIMANARVGGRPQTVTPGANPPSTPMASQGAPKPDAQTQFNIQQRAKAQAAEPKTMGAALRAAAARGEKTVKFGGKEYKVAFKDKAYQAKKAQQGQAFKSRQQVGQAQRFRPGGVQE